MVDYGPCFCGCPAHEYDGHTCEEYLERLSDDPVGRCSKCGRATWDLSTLGMTCYMPQPSGAAEPSCSGVFRKAVP